MTPSLAFRYRSLKARWILLPVIALIILGSKPAQIVLADAAPPPDPTVGGAVPYQPIQTKVQMVSETVLIDVPSQPATGEPRQIHVDASFTMRNQGGHAEQMQVIFPLTRLNFWTTEEALYRVDLDSFVVNVNGQPALITRITTPAELIGYDIDHGYVAEVQWAAFDVAFPIQQDLLLEVSYSMVNEYGLDGGPEMGFTGISYILETGAGWYRNIGSADITVRLPYPATEEAIIQANHGYILSGNEIRWHLQHFEPTRKDNLEVHVIQSGTWEDVLDLRAAVGKNPGDAAAWGTLGDRYMALGIDTGHGSVATVSPHFAELALEARRKLVELQPESGEAHFKLAQLLWLSNLTVQNWLRLGGNTQAPAPGLEDPAIQEIVKELELAWALGSHESVPYMDVVFPGLVSTPTIISATSVIPTGTLPATQASTMAPAAFSSVTPETGNTSSTGPHWILFAASLGLLIVGGLYVYLWRPRRRSR